MVLRDECRPVSPEMTHHEPCFPASSGGLGTRE
jgi:hypothetical protein